METKEMKCEKCGHFNPYWRTDWRDTEREFAKPEDIQWYSLASMPEDTKLKMSLGEIVEWNGFAWKQSKKFIRRIPLEIYKARGKWGLPYKARDYFDPASRPSGLRKE